MPYEQRRPDRTDHAREVDRRRRDRRREMPKEAIDNAFETVASHDVPGTPSAHQLRPLMEVHESEWETDTREVEAIKIRRGDPQHGAHRSDDHLATYEIRLPIAEVENEAVPGDTCPECGNERAVYKYSAYHHIAGGESLFCARCEELLHSEEWG